MKKQYEQYAKAFRIRGEHITLFQITMGGFEWGGVKLGMGLEGSL